MKSGKLKTAVRWTAEFINRTHWLWLILVSPLLLFPSPSRSPVLLVIPFLWVLAWLLKRQAFPRSAINPALLLLVSMVAVSIWATYDLEVSLSKISGVVLGLGVFYAVLREGKDSLGWWVSLGLLCILGLGTASMGLLGTNWIAKISFLTPLTSRLAPRISGMPGAEEGLHPNLVAGTLLWILPLMLALTWIIYQHNITSRVKGRYRWLVLIMVGAISLFTLVIFLLLQSRGAYIAAGTTVLLLLASYLWLNKRWVYLAGLLLSAVILGWLVLNYSVNTTASEASLESSFLSLNTLEGRLEIWSRAIMAIQDFPFTGMGMNTFRYVVHILYPLFRISPRYNLGHAHNEFLQVTLDLGIPGLIAFISLYLSAFWMLWNTWQRTKSIQKGTVSEQPMRFESLKNLFTTHPMAVSPSMVVLGLGNGLFAHLVWSLTDAIPLGSRTSFIFFLVLGLITALHRFSTHQEIQSTSGQHTGH